MPGYWLFKSEADCYSYDDLVAEGSTGWDGVRDFQARNFLRDDVKTGDRVFFYHSSSAEPAIAGIAEVIEAAHPDPTQFDPKAEHPDPKSDPSNPTWVQVRIRPLRAVSPPLTLARLKSEPALAGMELLRKGSRLSIQPVKPDEWKAVLKLAGIKKL